jgi:glyoxylase-like metal-dependent hydrolase (beta-lactamase superfamily II)
MATGWLEHGDRIDLGERMLEIFHTPGHSPGGISFLDREARAFFVGDLIYLGKMLLFFREATRPHFASHCVWRLKSSSTSTRSIQRTIRCR